MTRPRPGPGTPGLARYDELLPRAQARRVFGLTVRVADLDDIIESKEALSREADLVALPELQRLRDRLEGSGKPPDTPA